MHSFTKAACRYAVLISLFTSVAQGRVAPPPPERPIDEYGNLCWNDERARLDNLAIALQHSPDATGIIYFYDGNPPCYEAALARAMRAKKYIVEHRGIAWNRVMWRYVGHVRELTIRLDITFPGSRRYVPAPTVSPSEAKPKNCDAKIYRRPKCLPY
jgi:hypothetical protein